MHEDIYIFSQYQRENGEADVPMAGISFCDQSYFIERENYGHYVIEYTVEGEGVLEAGRKKWRICPKTTYFLYPGAGHRYYCPGGTWHKIWVVMTGKLAEALF